MIQSLVGDARQRHLLPVGAVGYPLLDDAGIDLSVSGSPLAQWSFLSGFSVSYSPARSTPLPSGNIRSASIGRLSFTGRPVCR